MSKTSERVVWLMLGLMTTATGIGCSDPQAGAPSPPAMMDGGAPPPTGNVDSHEKPRQFSGVFATTTPIDFTQNGVLPGVMGPTLAALIELHDHPGQAIVKLVVLANI